MPAVWMMAAGAVSGVGGSLLAGNSDKGKTSVTFTESPEQKAARGFAQHDAATVLTEGGSTTGQKNLLGAQRAGIGAQNLNQSQQLLKSAGKTGQIAPFISSKAMVENATRNSMTNAFLNSRTGSFSDIMGKYVKHNMQAAQQQNTNYVPEGDPTKDALMAFGSGTLSGAVQGVASGMAKGDTKLQQQLQETQWNNAEDIKSAIDNLQRGASAVPGYSTNPEFMGPAPEGGPSGAPYTPTYYKDGKFIKPPPVGAE